MFLGISGLIIPLLISIIAPIALLVAVMYALNKLATDSEIIVISARGYAAGAAAAAVSAGRPSCQLLGRLHLAVSRAESLRALRRWNTQLGADVLANVIQPGQFIKAGPAHLAHPERRPGGVLVGVFIDDKRDPSQRVNIVADRGTVIKNDRGSFIILEDGNLQRFEGRQARARAGRLQELCVRHVLSSRAAPERHLQRDRAVDAGADLAGGR